VHLPAENLSVGGKGFLPTLSPAPDKKRQFIISRTKQGKDYILTPLQ